MATDVQMQADQTRSLSRGDLVNERQRQAAAVGGESPYRSGKVLFQSSSDGFIGLGRAQQAPGSSAWELPDAPVHFPLRDALMSFKDPAAPLSPRSAATAAAIAAAAEIKPPLVAKHTQKSRALREVGRQRRKGLHWTGEESFPLTPRAPAERGRKPAPKVVHAHVLHGDDVKVMPPMTMSTKQEALRSAEEAGRSLWPLAEEARSAPNLVGAGDGRLSTTSSSAAGAGLSGGGPLAGSPGPRDTWTSAARTVLAHRRRFGGPSRGGKHAESSEPWRGPSARSLRGLPQPVQDWAAGGLEFTDAGLGIGPRFEPELRDLARRAPGPIYEQHAFGSVSRWSSDSTQPTKQPCSRHFSAETHRIGVRRDAQRKEFQRLGPGTYELPGFADELLQKLARRNQQADDSMGMDSIMSRLSGKSMGSTHR